MGFTLKPKPAQGLGLGGFRVSGTLRAEMSGHGEEGSVSEGVHGSNQASWLQRDCSDWEL